MHWILAAHVGECEPQGHHVHDGHAHQHAKGCGHVAVAHGDHADYVHDGTATPPTPGIGTTTDAG